MAYSTNFEASNKADFIVEISATDAETGDSIDFTGFDVAVSVKDKETAKLSAAIGDGITLMDDPTILQLRFTPEQMDSLCIGSYSIGGIYRTGGEITQLFTGTFSVYDGIASL